MRKIILIKLIIILLSSSFLYSQEETYKQLNQYNFYKLCKLFINENLNIKEAEMLEMEAKSEKNAALALLLPALSFEGTLFYDYEDFKKEYPLAGEITGKITQYFLGGSNLSITGEYIYSSLEKNVVNYEQSASISVYLYQSFCPYWLSIGAKNPDFYIPKLNYEYSTANKKYTKNTQLNNFILDYIEYKNLLRSKTLSEKNKAFYSEYKDAAINLYSDGNITLQNLEEINQKYYNALREYNSTIIKFDFCINNFCKLLNYKYDYNEIADLLNKSLEEPWEMIFKSLFPEWNFDELSATESNMQNTEIQLHKSRYLQQRQNLAPQFSLAANCDYDAEYKHSFSISIGLDLSNLFSPNNLTQKKKYKMERTMLLEKLNLSDYNNQTNKKTYSQNLELLFADYNYFTQECQALKEILNDYLIIYNKGNCSLLELMNIELLYIQSENNLEDCIDKISYYSLLLNIEISK